MNQQIRKILYKSNYQINETPKYKLVELINGGEQDEIPETPKKLDIVKEAGEEGGETIQAPATPQAEPAPVVPQTGATQPQVEPQQNIAPIEPIQAPVAPQPSLDDIQNDIIRMNIETMKIIHARVNELNNEVESLKNKNLESDKKIEALKPPTPGERLVNKKQDSHPFKYNLNDLWDGNHFQARRDELEENGIKRLEDGTYIADFDDLPNYSGNSIKNTY